MRRSFPLSRDPFVALLLFAGLAGCPSVNSSPCSSDEECPDGRCRQGACGPFCLSSAECGTEQLCQNGRCEPLPECASAADCASGFDCKAGQCQCTSDLACAANQSCIDGSCVNPDRCTADADCAGTGGRCELTQGVCLPPCALASDCAPGLDPRAATALYQCFQGGCYRRCLNDLACGGQGLICKDGLCALADCATLTDCPQGQYCTSSLFGRCLAFEPCQSNSDCPVDFLCERFPQVQCPPGFDCSQSLCRELPRCFIDADCKPLPGTSQDPAYCERSHCQPTKACVLGSDCALGTFCIGGLCVPGACRGLTDCPASERCVDGACAPAPAPGDVNLLSITPRRSVIEVGDTLELTLIAYRLDGSSFPLPTASFEVLDAQGNPSSAASVDSSGKLLALAEGEVRVRGSLPGSFVGPKESSVSIHGKVTSGRTVLAIDAATGLPLQGVRVLGCDGALGTSGVCPAPVELTTDSRGEAHFAAFVSPTASFSALAEQTRSDGLLRYDRLSVVDTGAPNVLLPFTENPVHGAAGFNATIQFGSVHSSGTYWAGYAVASFADPSAMSLRLLLGDPFQVDLPGIQQGVPVPGSLVLFTSPGFGIPQEIKSRSLGLGQAGTRAVTAFAGRSELSGALAASSLELLAYTGAMDFALQPPALLSHRAYVADLIDVDGDGLCGQSSKCPLGPEDVPDYAAFTQLSLAPKREQKLRTSVVVPSLPSTLDTVLLAVVQQDPEAGLVPLGFASRVAGPPGSDGTRPVDSPLMKSGAPYGGLEVGTVGIWALASSSAASNQVTARLTRGPVLPPRVLLPPFLPVPQSASYVSATRTLSPGQPAWNALYSSGAELARAVVTGPKGRHLVYFAIAPNQGTVPVPAGPASVDADPASSSEATLELTALDLSPGLSADEILGLGGANLLQLSTHLDGYSRLER